MTLEQPGRKFLCLTYREKDISSVTLLFLPSVVGSNKEQSVMIQAPRGDDEIKDVGNRLARSFILCPEKRFDEIPAEYGLGFDEKESVIRSIAKE